MKDVFVFLAEGFEEIEAITIIDVLRRGDVKVTTVSVTKNNVVTGVHGVPVTADVLFEDVDFSNGEMLILPGGGPGSQHLNEHAALKQLIADYYEAGRKVAAICAAPIVFGGLGILNGKKATCYPGCEAQLTGAVITGEPVVKDGNVITGKGPGLAAAFSLEVLAELKGASAADQIAKDLLLK
jgi:DJ-1 family protein